MADCAAYPRAFDMNFSVHYFWLDPPSFSVARPSKGIQQYGYTLCDSRVLDDHYPSTMQPIQPEFGYPSSKCMQQLAVSNLCEQPKLFVCNRNSSECHLLIILSPDGSCVERFPPMKSSGLPCEE